MYTVFICASRMPIPIQFTVHTWIVTECDGVRTRFDVFGFEEDRGVRHGYFYKNFSAPYEGCPMFALGKYRFLENVFRWRVDILYEIKGGEGSDAGRMYWLLHNNFDRLPFIDTYHLLRGPNSNSFTQWVLDRVASGKYPLPWRAYGKNWVGN